MRVFLIAAVLAVFVTPVAAYKPIIGNQTIKEMCLDNFRIVKLSGDKAESFDGATCMCIHHIAAHYANQHFVMIEREGHGSESDKWLKRSHMMTDIHKTMCK